MTVQEKLHDEQPKDLRKVKISTESTDKDELGNLAEQKNFFLSCLKCKREISNQKLWNEHKRNCKKQWTCSICGVKCLHKYSYRKHMDGHSRNLCPSCPQTFSKSIHLKEHLKQSHNMKLLSKMFNCSLCSMSFIKKSSLFSHLKIHANSKEQVVCDKCGAFVQNDFYSKHMLEHTSEAVSQCSICDATFMHQYLYERHMKKHEIHVCNYCEDSFSNKKKLFSHCNSMHANKQQVVSLDKEYICSECGRRFPRPSLLDSHMRLHKGEHPFVCTPCGRNYADKGGLRRHLKSSAHGRMVLPAALNDDNVESCPHCSYTTTRSGYLERHIKNKHGHNPTYVCEKCGCVLASLTALKDHKSFLHSDERSFKCQICSKLFKTNPSLKRHEKTHSSDCHFECYCGRKYKRMEHLKRHEFNSHGIVAKSKNVDASIRNMDGDSSSTLLSQLIESNEMEQNIRKEYLLPASSCVSHFAFHILPAENISGPSSHEFPSLAFAPFNLSLQHDSSTLLLDGIKPAFEATPKHILLTDADISHLKSNENQLFSSAEYSSNIIGDANDADQNFSKIKFVSSDSKIENISMPLATHFANDRGTQVNNVISQDFLNMSIEQEEANHILNDSSYIFN